MKNPQDHKKSKKKGKNKGSRVTSKSQWKATSGGTELEVPSGNVALVRAPGMQVFIEQGLIPNTLMPIVQKAISEKKPPNMEELEITEESLAQMVEMIDAVAIYCVIEPALTTNKNPDGELIPEKDRDEELLYVDEVDVQDKLFIFQFAVGGVRDLERFRKQQEQAMESLPGGETLAFAPEPTPEA